MKICLFVVLMLSSQGKCWKPEIYSINSLDTADNAVALKWIYPVTLSEYSSYVIKYKPTKEPSFKEVVTTKLESDVVINLLPDTEYEFNVLIEDYIKRVDYIVMSPRNYRPEYYLNTAQLPRMSSRAVITTESWGKELSKPKIFKIEVEDATYVDIQWYYPLRFQKFVIKYRPTKSESNFSKIDLPFNHINITEKIGKSFVKLENLSPNTEYEFYVCPENDPKNEKPYSRAVITTQEYWKPEIYSINSLDTADNAVALKWIYPATLHEYFSYVIKYKPTYRTSFKEVVRTKLESDEVINLLPDTEYEFYVFIKDDIVGAPLPRMSSPAVITTRSWGKELSKPKIFKIEVEQDTSVVIRWYYPLRFQKFVIKYKPTKSETTISEIDLPFNHIKITEKIGKSFVKLENLSPNTEYEFYVCPENDPENEKPYSRAVITTQEYWKPEIYSINSLDTADNAVALKWIYPATLPNIYSYVIKYKPTNRTSFKEVVRTKLESDVVINLLPDTEYEFYVFIKDYNIAAPLPRMSSPAVITTESWGKELSKPKIFKIEVEHDTSVVIRWYYPLRFQKFVIKYKPTKSETTISEIDLPFNHIKITEKIGRSFVKLENLSPNTEYEFYVCPENDPENEKPYSRAVITTQGSKKAPHHGTNGLSNRQ